MSDLAVSTDTCELHVTIEVDPDDVFPWQWTVTDEHGNTLTQHCCETRWGARWAARRWCKRWARHGGRPERWTFTREQVQ